MNVFLRYFLFFLFSVCLIISITSCEDKITESEIPSYIRIDTIPLTTDYNEQGTASNKITDAWVYIDDNLVGAFELPAQFPVLASGKHKITVRPGIKLNGISATRYYYYFYSKYDITTTLYQDSVIKINPTTTYADYTYFAWKEDFESGSISLQRDSKSDTGLVRATGTLAFEGNVSGLAVLDGDRDTCEISSTDAFSLPTSGTKSIYLELNYKNNVPFTVGLIVNDYGLYSHIYHEVLILNKTDVWKKVYVNLTPSVSTYSGAKNFGIFFGFVRDTSAPKAEVYLDNIKLVHPVIN